MMQETPKHSHHQTQAGDTNIELGHRELIFVTDIKKLMLCSQFDAFMHAHIECLLPVHKW